MMAGQPTPLTYPPLKNKDLIAGIKGNQWLNLSPYHKALFLGRVTVGRGRLFGHKHRVYHDHVSSGMMRIQQPES